MTDAATIRKAVDLLQQAAKPRKIILFGSHARGDAREDSDVDFLVIERSVPNRVAEMVRLRRILSPLRIPVDVRVVSEEAFREWSTTPGTVLYEAALEGKVLYDAA